MRVTATPWTALSPFLGYDDATQVTPEHVVGFKDHRLSSINPRTKKPISAKTVKDSDLSALKTLFGWAVSNHRLTNNPATGITIKLGKRRVTRPKGFTDEEAKALLEAADAHRQGNEQPKTSAAKRWVPWLCAYTGARVGEVAQARADTLGYVVFLGDSDETRLVDAILLEQNDVYGPPPLCKDVGSSQARPVLAVVYPALQRDRSTAGPDDLRGSTARQMDELWRSHRFLGVCRPRSDRCAINIPLPSQARLPSGWGLFGYAALTADR